VDVFKVFPHITAITAAAAAAASVSAAVFHLTQKERENDTDLQPSVCQVSGKLSITVKLTIC
jgi:hypothetical protein